MAGTALIKSSVAGKAVRLAGGASIVRPLPFPAKSWDAIRISIRMQGEDIGSAYGAVRFFVGLCSGSANPFAQGTTTTTHAIGYSNYASFSSYSAANYTNASARMIKRVGTTETDGTEIDSIYVPLAGGGEQWALTWSLSKTSTPGVFSQRAYGPGSSTASTYTDTYFNLNRTAPFGAMANADGHIEHGTGSSFSVDEGADGVLDHVQVYWSSTSAYLDILDVAVDRILPA